MNTSLVMELRLPPPCKKEILRYSGAPEATYELELILDECISKCKNSFGGRVCYREFSISKEGETLDLGFAETDSLLLKRLLSGYGKTVLFAATVGIETDRLIEKYKRLSPTKALIFQAIGAERIEALCDEFEKEMGRVYSKCSHRVSPGYGDIPISMQREIFSALDCPKKIGLSLTDSLLMTPTKSVTAIMGVSEKE